MPEQYPFVLANSRVGPLLDAISSAAKPPRFSGEFLRALGFTSSNDRAFVPLFRTLGFTEENGTPNEAYDRLRDRQMRPQVMAERLRETYADLFTINTNIQDASDDEIKGAISRVTGKDATTVSRYFNTFKTLASFANFKAGSPTKVELKAKDKPEEQDSNPPPYRPNGNGAVRSSEFHYNIQIHLPATNDVSVYNAIFRALKENLDI